MTIPTTSKAVTANRLSDGTVVFLDGDYGWTEKFAAARLVSADAELEDMTLIAAHAENFGTVVAFYVIDIDIDPASGVAKPVLLRERIRAFGPTVSEQPTHLIA